MVVSKSHSQEEKKIYIFSGVKNAYLGDRFSSVSYYIFIYKTVHTQELRP